MNMRKLMDAITDPYEEAANWVIDQWEPYNATANSPDVEKHIWEDLMGIWDSLLIRAGEIYGIDSEDLRDWCDAHGIEGAGYYGDFDDIT